MNIVLSEKGAKSLDRVLAYLYAEEHKHLEDVIEKEGADSIQARTHIFLDIDRLNKEVEFNFKNRKDDKSGESDDGLAESPEGPPGQSNTN
jgi:hypothetical protein